MKDNSIKTCSNIKLQKKILEVKNTEKAKMLKIGKFADYNILREECDKMKNLATDRANINSIIYLC